MTTYYLTLIFIFLNMNQLYKLMKKEKPTEILFFKKKDKNHQKKILDCKFIRININKENYDADYETGRIQTFITKSTKKLMVNEISKRHALLVLLENQLFQNQ